MEASSLIMIPPGEEFRSRISSIIAQIGGLSGLSLVQVQRLAKLLPEGSASVIMARPDIDEQTLEIVRRLISEGWATEVDGRLYTTQYAPR